jgi:hypothetical protein
MIELVFLQRIYGRVSKRSFGDCIREICEKLDAEVEKITILEGGWVKVEVVGEDEVVATNLLMKRVFSPTITSWNDLHRFSVCNGRVTSCASRKMELGVAISANPLAMIRAFIPLTSLQSGLVDGRKFALKRIISLFGLVEDFPLEVRVTDVNPRTRQCEVELTENQISIYDNWIKSRVDRLLIFGTLEKRLHQTIRRLNLHRDVISVKPLSLLEHVLTCKLGTDAKGLIPRLGAHLPSVKLHVFSPRSILPFIDSRY